MIPTRPTLSIIFFRRLIIGTDIRASGGRRTGKANFTINTGNAHVLGNSGSTSTDVAAPAGVIRSTTFSDELTARAGYISKGIRIGIKLTHNIIELSLRRAISLRYIVGMNATTVLPIARITKLTPCIKAVQLTYHTVEHLKLLGRWFHTDGSMVRLRIRAGSGTESGCQCKSRDKTTSECWSYS